MKAQQQVPRHRRRRLGLVVGTPLALVSAGVLAYGAVFGTFGDDSRPQASAAPRVPDDATAAVAAMQPGWNLGNSLDATPDETSWGMPRVTEALMDEIRAQGFHSVRIPVTWSAHQGAAPDYTIDPAYVSRVRQVVDWALDDGLYVMLDVHHDSWQWVKKMSTEHDQVLARYRATWSQIAKAFRNEPAALLFESVNEPQFDEASAARRAELLHELNTSFHDIVRGSGGGNAQRLLVLPTIGDTPDQGLMDDLATTIRSLHDTRLVASVHYYGYYPFSVNVAGQTRFDGAAQADLAKVFKRVHDTFLARGIPTVFGEYGVLGYDFGPSGGVERGEMLKYFEAFGAAARTRGVATFLWDNGSFFDRTSMKWHDPGLFQQIRSSWTTTSGAASSDMVFVPGAGPVTDRTLTLNPNGAAFRGLRQGGTDLVKGRDYTLSGNRMTLKAAALNRLAGDRSHGVHARLQARFSRGVPWSINVIAFRPPVLSATTGTSGSFRIPSRFSGDVLATMQATYPDGTPAGPTTWSSYQQFNTAFSPDYTKNVVSLPSAFLNAFKDGTRVKLTFHFWSGTTATYYVTRSGTSVTGTTA
ncbi:cellulase family glycosylhydrolase [Streptomyces lasalocidi]